MRRLDYILECAKGAEILTPDEALVIKILFDFHEGSDIPFMETEGPLKDAYTRLTSEEEGM